MGGIDNLERLERHLGYVFSDKQLLSLSLTHRSKGSKNYERLEFLGDSILGFVIAKWLYAEFPKLAEGKLSRMRSSLVRKETLAGVARSMELGNFLILGEGELKSGGFNRDSILADVVESLIGGIYLDSGFEEASRFILDKFSGQLKSISEHSNFKDPKSELQEFMQKKGLALPSYVILETQGEDHQQEFSVECRLADISISAIAVANTRRRAEQKSAALVLEQVKQESSQKSLVS